MKIRYNFTVIKMWTMMFLMMLSVAIQGSLKESKDKLSNASFDSSNSSNATLAESYGITQLEYAIRENDLPGVKKIIASGIDINSQHSNDEPSLLHQALDAHCSMSMLKYLLDHGAYVNAQDNLGATPLHLAARYLDFNALELLLEYRASVNKQDYQGDTALMTVLRKELGNNRNHSDIQKNIVFYLVKAGADVNIVSAYDGKTPLDIARIKVRYHGMSPAILKCLNDNSDSVQFKSNPIIGL